MRTDYRGVSTVPEFIRLTVEIRDPEYAAYGPYGQKIGRFENAADDANDFVIKSVKVFANDDFDPYVNSVDDFDDMTAEYNTYIALGAAAGALMIAGAVAAIVVIVKRRNAAK